MKKLYALPLAVLALTACSESTGPESASSLSPSYAKGGNPGKPGGGGGGGGGTPITVFTANDSYNFDGEIIASAGSAWGTQLDPSAQGAASSPTIATVPGTSNKFLGRFEETHTQALLTVANGGEKYELEFDLYIIGSWDGKGKQAQHGVFEANIVQIGYQCTPFDIQNIFSTTFSNQLTVQQDYPAPAFSGGGSKAGTGAVSTDALGYKNYPLLSNTPLFRSFGDAIYRMKFAGANPCGSGNTVTFVIGTSNPTQQNMWDESWGIDNLMIKAGS